MRRFGVSTVVSVTLIGWRHNAQTITLHHQEEEIYIEPSGRLCGNEALVLQLGHFYFRPPQPIAKIETSPVCRFIDTADSPMLSCLPHVFRRSDRKSTLSSRMPA